jgi:uncharacterized protein
MTIIRSADSPTRVAAVGLAASDQIARMVDWFKTQATVRVACSGGIDSLLLAHLAHDAIGRRAQIVHAISPAVPPEATTRVRDEALRMGWAIEFVEGGEFSDELYLVNPIDRCFHCKSHLYTAIEQIQSKAGLGKAGTIVSGTNLDDLQDYRPGLKAAEAFGVRHPYIECGAGKSGIRAMARELGLHYAELPASPCLASRLYTGTRVTASRLRFIHRAENLVRTQTVCQVVRCRLEGRTMRIEVPDGERHLITDVVLDALRALASEEASQDIDAVILDLRGYAPGRAFVGAKA